MQPCYNFSNAVLYVLVIYLLNFVVQKKPYIVLKEKLYYFYVGISGLETSDSAQR